MYIVLYEIKMEEDDKLYLYVPMLEDSDNICCTEKEKDEIVRNIPISESRFIEQDCDENKSYYVINEDKHCSKCINFRKVYNYLTKKDPKKFYYVDTECKKYDIYLESTDLYDFYGYRLHSNTSKILTQQINDRGNIDSHIFLNCILNYGGPLYHHISFVITKIFPKIIEITAIDTMCWPNEIIKKMYNTFNNIYNIVLKLGVEIRIKCAYNEFIHTKIEDIKNMDDSELDEVYKNCPNIQLKELIMSQNGYCVGWSLYFFTPLEI